MSEENEILEEERPNWRALIPFVVFVIFYVGLSILAKDFYKIPMPVAFIVASATAMLSNRKMTLQKKMDGYYTEVSNTHWFYRVDQSADPGTSNAGTVDDKRANIRLTYSIGCTPTWSYSNTAYYISNFKAKVDGESTYQINNTTTGTSCSTSDYYSTYSISASAGSTISYLATPSSSSTWRYGLWVDWNNDGDFSDSGEEIYNTSSYITISEQTFTIPSGTPAGEYRMRVIIDSGD